jgi:hypothetical protein
VFQARLSDPQTSRKFWVGVDRPIFDSNGVNAASIASNIFSDLRAKDVIGSAGAEHGQPKCQPPFSAIDPC